MRELSLIATIVVALATTIVLAQEELKPAAPAPAASEPAARANPFTPLDAGPPSGSLSASLPAAESAPAAPEAAAPLAAPAAVAKLNGILYCESKSLVVINDLIAGVGDEVFGMRVMAIARDKVTLAGPRGAYVMTPLQPEARLAPEVSASPPQAETPRVEADAEAAADEETPKAADGAPALAAETVDQPIGKENQ